MTDSWGELNEVMHQTLRAKSGSFYFHLEKIPTTTPTSKHQETPFRVNFLLAKGSSNLYDMRDLVMRPHVVTQVLSKECCFLVCCLQTRHLA